MARTTPEQLKARLQAAALTDEEGRALATELTRIPAAPAARLEQAERVAGV